MQPDGLRLIVLNERETGKLSEISPDLFSTSRSHLSQLQEQVYASEDPLGNETRAIVEEIQNIQETMKDIFRIRLRKILTLAWAQVDSNYADREEMKRMLPVERETYERIVEALGSYRRVLLEGLEHGPRIQTAPEQATVPAAPTPVPAVPEHGVPCTLVRILADVDPFVGVDGRVYRLVKGDIITLPAKNADVLCERNIALNMNASIL